MKKQHRSSTLALLYLRQVSAGLLIYQPIFVPFLLNRGMNMLDVAFLNMAYNLGVVALDIPSGFFADKFGRKWALMVANLGLAIGTALIAMGHSLQTFIIAELFYSLAIAMDSGTHSAYLFEWLRRQGRESEYYRYDAFGTFLFLVVGATGTLIAGFYAEKNLTQPVVWTIILTSIGIPAACLLPRMQEDEGSPEGVAGLSPPAAAKGTRVASSIQKYEAFSHHAKSILTTIKEVVMTPGIRWALGVTVVWYWARQYINLIISQPYFRSIGLPLRDYGMFYSILTLSSGFIALFSRRLIQKPDLRIITLFGLILIPTSFASMGLISTKAGLAGFFLFAIPYGLCTAITNTLLNRQFTRHEERATFLSIVDFFVRIVASALAFGLGYVLHHNGASAALLGAAAFAGLAFVSLIPGAFKFAKS